MPPFSFQSTPLHRELHHFGRKMVGVSGCGAGADNARELEKPEARKMLENGDESPLSV
jgi:hypothetical protein